MEKNVRLRILLVMEIIMERTDEEHGVTMQDILQWLEHNDVAGERKSIYEDIHALQDYGLDIDYNKEDKSYRLLTRQMELSELKLLVDAVHASKFITQKRTNQIISHLMEYASAYDRKALSRDVYTEKPKTILSSGYYSMDILHEAIAHDRQVSFQYSQWTIEKKLQVKHEGARYLVSPWLMVWEDENYYLVAYDEHARLFKHFRVDKISGVQLEDGKRSAKAEFDKMEARSYTTSHFGMFGGNIRRVKIRFENCLIGVVLDRFGRDVVIMPEGKDHFSVNVEVAVTNQFFAWIFGFGKEAQIQTPEVAEQMKKLLTDTAKNY